MTPTYKSTDELPQARAVKDALDSDILPDTQEVGHNTCSTSEETQEAGIYHGVQEPSHTTQNASEDILYLNNSFGAENSKRTMCGPSKVSLDSGISWGGKHNHTAYEASKDARDHNLFHGLEEFDIVTCDASLPASQDCTYGTQAIKGVSNIAHQARQSEVCENGKQSSVILG